MPVVVLASAGLEGPGPQPAVQRSQLLGLQAQGFPLLGIKYEVLRRASLVALTRLVQPPSYVHGAEPGLRVRVEAVQLRVARHRRRCRREELLRLHRRQALRWLLLAVRLRSVEVRMALVGVHRCGPLAARRLVVHAGQVVGLLLDQGPLPQAHLRLLGAPKHLVWDEAARLARRLRSKRRSVAGYLREPLIVVPALSLRTIH